jgi:hypothetical protein
LREVGGDTQQIQALLPIKITTLQIATIMIAREISPPPHTPAGMRRQRRF